jgi:ADP-ribosylglycohydrolase
MKIAKRNKRNGKEFSIPKRIAVEISLSDKEYKKLCIGRVSQSMDEKWNDLVENDLLTCYRSWTGNPIFQAKINQNANNEYQITEFIGETDKERIKLNSEEELKSMFKSHVSYLINREIRNSIEDALIGFITADALGVPVEFKSREYLKHNPVTDMFGYGTYNQPKGTWSDDSTMTLCLAETLLDEEFSLKKLANRFINWVDWGYWTPHGELFDIGNTTHAAVERLRTIEDPKLAGGKHETENGNGSLMRILPLVFELYDINDEGEQYKIIKDISSLTHGHERSILSCFYYLTFARFLRDHYYPPIEMYKLTNNVFKRFVDNQSNLENETKHFDRLLNDSIQDLDESKIRSSGYVIDTLEAAVWCLLTTKNYKEAVLKAVNLGEDTDTVAAITGGLAGLYYGKKQIPEDWINSLAKLVDINEIIDKLSDKYGEARC